MWNRNCALCNKISKKQTAADELFGFALNLFELLVDAKTQRRTITDSDAAAKLPVDAKSARTDVDDVEKPTVVLDSLYAELQDLIANALKIAKNVLHWGTSKHFLYSDFGASRPRLQRTIAHCYFSLRPVIVNILFK